VSCALEHPAAVSDSGVTADVVDGGPNPRDAPDVDDVADANDDVADANDDDVADAPGDDVADANDDDVADASDDDVADASDDDSPAARDVLDAAATDASRDVPDAAAPDVPDAAAPDVPDAAAPDAARDVPDAAPDATRDVPDAAAPDVAAPDVVAPDASPSRFTIASSDTRVTMVVGSIGSPFDATRVCAANEVLVGAAIQHSRYVNGLAARCAELRPDGTLGPTRETGFDGGGNGTRSADDCPAGTVVVAITGRAAGIIDQLALQCAPVASWLADRVVTATTAPRGGTGGSPFTQSCPVGFVGRGFTFDQVSFDWSTRVSQLRLSCVRVNRSP
jgi:hypothetical protein